MKVITTVGTSLLNNIDNDRSSGVKINEKLLKKEYKEIFFELGSSKEELGKLAEYIIKQDKNKRAAIEQWTLEHKANSCAEINSILKIKNEVDKDDNIIDKKLDVYLVCTQTIPSKIAADVIKTFFAAQYPNKIEVQCVKVIDKLNVDNQANYDEGFSNLIQHLADDIKHEEGDILNITGGYKALVPILTLYGQLQNLTLKYIYNDSELDNAQLITLGQLPISFDWTIFENNNLAFESIKPIKEKGDSIRLKISAKEEFLAFFNEEREYADLLNQKLVLEVDEKIRLTTLGYLLYTQYNQNASNDDFNISSLLGKVMEMKVLQFFKSKYSDSNWELEHNIGKSLEGNPYDIDVFGESEQKVWSIEVKPFSVDVIERESMKEKKKKKTIEYKCHTGAFHEAYTQYSDKELEIVLFMYHFFKPERKIEELRKINQKYPSLRLVFLWGNPPKNYKGNVNWSFNQKNVKQYNFETNKWVDF